MSLALHIPGDEISDDTPPVVIGFGGDSLFQLRLTFDGLVEFLCSLRGPGMGEE